MCWFNRTVLRSWHKIPRRAITWIRTCITFLSPSILSFREWKMTGIGRIWRRRKAEKTLITAYGKKLWYHVNVFLTECCTICLPEAFIFMTRTTVLCLNHSKLYFRKCSRLHNAWFNFVFKIITIFWKVNSCCCLVQLVNVLVLDSLV